VKILIADDDPQLVRALRITLAAHGYDVVAAPDGQAAIALAAKEHPEIVMVDLGMPRLDGVRVIEALRGWTAVPIIVVSGRTGSADKVEALDAGADDYVTTPVQIDELLARLRALSRRSTASANEPVVSFGDVSVDLAAKLVTRGGAPVHLTPTEWRILEFLARNAGALVTRQALLKDIWGTEQVTDTGYLRLYLSQLRKKLEADPARPRHLLTEAGMGYRLVLDPA
jgi:two-component system KDP operon response regulator KdpE